MEGCCIVSESFRQGGFISWPLFTAKATCVWMRVHVISRVLHVVLLAVLSCAKREPPPPPEKLYEWCEEMLFPKVSPLNIMWHLQQCVFTVRISEWSYLYSFVVTVKPLKIVCTPSGGWWRKTLTCLWCVFCLYMYILAPYWLFLCCFSAILESILLCVCVCAFIVQSHHSVLIQFVVDIKIARGYV